MLPLHIFCFCISHVCSPTGLHKTTLMRFIQISDIIFKHITFSLLIRVYNVFGNQPSPPSNIFGVFYFNLIVNIDLVSLVRGGGRLNESQKKSVHTQRLVIRIIRNKVINQTLTLFI